MGTCFAFIPAFLALAAACSDPRSAADASGGPSDAGPTADGAPPVPCSADTLCLTVVPQTPGQVTPDGRLVVIFYQLDDSAPVPYAVTHDAPFAGTTTQVAIPFADLSLPPVADPDDYYLCLRPCSDLSNPLCDCPAGEPRAALAMVLVLVDRNGSGAIEQAEIDDPNIYGVGYMQLAESDAAYPMPGVLLVYFFPEGIVEGLAPYEIIPDGNPPFDQLGIPPADTVFDLNVCVPGSAACDSMPFPNLT